MSVAAARTPDLLHSGADLAVARGAVVLVHGRGATAKGILPLGHELELPDLALVAPQAPSHSWYPHTFLAPREENEPALGESLGILDQAVHQALRTGLPETNVFLLGFSQGACLALEYAYRRERPLGGVVGLTGGLIGAPGTLERAGGRLEGLAALLASGDPDPHVPWERVEETARLFSERGATVELQRYPGLEHTVIPDEIDGARRLIGGRLRAGGEGSTGAGPAEGAA